MGQQIVQDFGKLACQTRARRARDDSAQAGVARHHLQRAAGATVAGDPPEPQSLTQFGASWTQHDRNGEWWAFGISSAAIDSGRV
jgi:hypothetical protein